jgi:hypothetical protein
MDNLNLKQAIKQGGISLLTVYVDHICDSLACSFIALTLSNLLGFSNVESWFIVLGFSLLPYYIDHLKMYYADKLEFEIVNPVDEGTSYNYIGLVLLQLICVISVVSGPDIWSA